MQNRALEKLKQHPLMLELCALDKKYDNRYEFHKHLSELLLRIAADKEFLALVIKRNLEDEGFLNQKWSLYNIPFLHILETDDFIFKIHLFPTAEKWNPGVAAHAIHHHNNYILTTNAFFGSGYESLLFEKQISMDANTLKTDLKIRKHFHQKDWNPSMVDSWEPHVVFVPEVLSATMLVWTPDKKRPTDTLRNNALLKSIKVPLRKLIQFFGLADAFGISHGKTYQWYASPDGNGFMAVEEEQYFLPTKLAVGPEIDNYSIQMLFAFIQRMQLVDKEYLKAFMANSETPEYYKKWVDMAIQDIEIPDVYHREEINIPQKRYTIADIYSAAKQAI